MKSLATLAFAVAVAGCGVPRPEPPPPPAPSPVTVTLTAQSATASIQMPPMTDLRGVRMTVVALNNPAAQGLLIKVTLASPDGRVANLGTFSPFPVDRPGSSTHLPLPADGADIAAGPASIALQMTAIPEGAQINPGLTITLVVTPTSG